MTRHSHAGPPTPDAEEPVGGTRRSRASHLCARGQAADHYPREHTRTVAKVTSMPPPANQCGLPPSPVQGPCRTGLPWMATASGGRARPRGAGMPLFKSVGHSTDCAAGGVATSRRRPGKAAGGRDAPAAVKSVLNRWPILVKIELRTVVEVVALEAVVHRFLLPFGGGERELDLVP